MSIPVTSDEWLFVNCSDPSVVIHLHGTREDTKAKIKAWYKDKQFFQYHAYEFYKSL